jgi:hypothetical protein
MMTEMAGRLCLACDKRIQFVYILFIESSRNLAYLGDSFWSCYASVLSWEAECYELRCDGKVIEGFGADLWKLGLLCYSTRGATVQRVLFTPRVVAAARVGGAQGTPAAGLHPRPAREKGFPSNLLLD